MGFPFVRDQTNLYAIALHSLIVMSVLGQLASLWLPRRPFGTLYRLLRGVCPLFLHGLLQLRNFHLFTGDGKLLTFLRRKQLLAPWTLQHTAVLIIFIAANATCVFTRYLDLPEAGRRAGRLAMVNAAMLYAGPHLGFLADMVGTRVLTYRRIHSSVSLTAFVLSAFHVAVALLDGKTRLLLTTRYLFALLSAVAFFFQSVFFPMFRHLLWYEAAICLHQVAAVGLAYAALRHIGGNYLILAVPAAFYLIASSLTQLLIIVYRNGLRVCTATVTYDCDTTLVSLNIPGRKLQVDAGQYMELWMPLNAEHGPYLPGLPNLHGDRSGPPSLITRLYAFWRRAGYPLSTFTWWQSHPFMVASWSEKPISDLSMIIQPKEGWTKRLHNVAKLHYFNELLRWKKLAELLEREKKTFWQKEKNNQNGLNTMHATAARMRLELTETVSYKTIAVLSGPHGRAIETRGYSRVVAIARSTFVFACMPFVRKIIRENCPTSGQSHVGCDSRGAELDKFHFVYETIQDTWESKEIENFVKEIPVGHRRQNPDIVNRKQPEEAFHATVYAPTGKGLEIFAPRAVMKNGPMDLEAVLAEEMQTAKGHRTLILAGLDVEDTCLMLRFLNDQVRLMCTNFTTEDFDVIWSS